MRKSEMTAQQLQERCLIISSLSAAGWKDLAVGNWFERGLWAKYEASLGYENDPLSFQVHYSCENKAINLLLEDELGREISLIIYFEGHLRALLETIISLQDKLSTDNYQQGIRKILQVCPTTTYVAMDEDTIAQLIDDQEAVAMVGREERTQMLKTELSPQQLAKRSLFVKQLVAAKWKSGGWEQLFDNGASLTPEAQAEYQNADVDLRLSYYLKDDYILLEFMSHEDAYMPSLRFYPNGNLDRILDTVTARQGTLSSDSYPDLIKSIIPLCERVLLESEVGVVKLSLREA